MSSVVLDYVKEGRKVVVNSKELITDLRLLQDYFTRIISEVFVGKSLNLITIEPQPYSLVADLQNDRKVKIGSIALQVNKVDICTRELLFEIGESEEFERGLLLLVQTDSQLTDENIKTVYLIATNDNLYTDLPLGIVYREADGKRLCSYNIELNP